MRALMEVLTVVACGLQRAVVDEAVIADDHASVFAENSATVTSAPPARQRESVNATAVRADQEPSLSAGIQNRLVRCNASIPVFLVETTVKINPGWKLEIMDDIHPRRDQDGVAVRFTGAVSLTYSKSNVAVGSVSRSALGTVFPRLSHVVHLLVRSEVDRLTGWPEVSVGARTRSTNDKPKRQED